LKETDRERLLRERKSALNKLFDKTNLQPILDGLGGEGGEAPSGSSSSQSKRQLLERMEKKKSSGGGEDQEEEEDEMSEIQLNLVCKFFSLFHSLSLSTSPLAHKSIDEFRLESDKE